MNEPYQSMPPLSDDEYDALKADIATRGVLVPIEVDETGAILDGHHRHRACTELGIDPPTVVRPGLTEAEKHEHALRLNLARRHLTQSQRRDLIRQELERDPDRSDRAIARLVGASHPTVAAVRREINEVVNPSAPEPVTPAEQGRRAAGGRTPGVALDEHLARLPTEGRVSALLDIAQGCVDASLDPEFLGPVFNHIVGPRVRAVLCAVDWPDQLDGAIARFTEFLGLLGDDVDTSALSDAVTATAERMAVRAGARSLLRTGEPGMPPAVWKPVPADHRRRALAERNRLAMWEMCVGREVVEFTDWCDAAGVVLDFRKCEVRLPERLRYPDDDGVAPADWTDEDRHMAALGHFYAWYHTPDELRAMAPAGT